MRKPRLLMMLALALCGTTAQAQEPSRVTRTPEAAAAQGLEILRSLAGQKGRELGFVSDADAARATLGTPLEVYNVDLGALREFKSGDDPAALLEASPAAFYPVLVDGAVRSSVRIENTGEGWEAARVGNAGVATAVDQGRRAFASPDATVLVQVLALNLLFVGRKGGDGWQLAPVVDDASVALQVGRAEPAATVFARLAPIAARHNGDPT